MNEFVIGNRCPVGQMAVGAVMDHYGEKIKVITEDDFRKVIPGGPMPGSVPVYRMEYLLEDGYDRNIEMTLVSLPNEEPAAPAVELKKVEPMSEDELDGLDMALKSNLLDVVGISRENLKVLLHRLLVTIRGLQNKQREDS